MWPDLQNDSFLRACLRQPTPHTPVWLMRQAGRYLPEYKATRVKAGNSFMGLATNVHYATEVTLQPLDRYALDAVSQDVFGKPAAYMGEGGTIPFMGMLGRAFPKAQFVVTGVLGPNSNAHGPNEFLHIRPGEG